jgi:S-formylglutathione hydrolase
MKPATATRGHALRKPMIENWTSVEIVGKKADVYDPSGSRPRFGVLHLHGVGLETLHDRPAFTRWLHELRLACVCPHGQRSWWGDRICAEFDLSISPERFLLDQVMPFFQERWGLGPRAVGLQGISMGGQGALRLAFKHPDLFPVVAAISAAIDYHDLYGQGTTLDDMYDSKEQCRQDTALLHIHPSQSPAHIFFCIDPDDSAWYRGNDRLHEKLNALGVPHEIDLTTRAGGHSWDYFNHTAERVERFVHTALEHESRRLL